MFPYFEVSHDICLPMFVADISGKRNRTELVIEGEISHTCARHVKGECSSAISRRILGRHESRDVGRFTKNGMLSIKANDGHKLTVQILSLRTTVSQQCCALMQELPEHLGSSFDPFVETALPVLGKMA